MPLFKWFQKEHLRSEEPLLCGKSRFFDGSLKNLCGTKKAFTFLHKCTVNNQIEYKKSKKKCAFMS